MAKSLIRPTLGSVNSLLGSSGDLESRWLEKSFGFPKLLRGAIEASPTLKDATGEVLDILRRESEQGSRFRPEERMEICYYSGSTSSNLANASSLSEVGSGRDQLIMVAGLTRYEYPCLVFCMPEIVTPETEERLMPQLRHKIGFRREIISSGYVFLELRRGWENSVLASFEHRLAKRLGIQIDYDDSNIYLCHPKMPTRSWPKEEDE